MIALRETRRPLTVDQINQRVAGYQGERDSAWRRMFERDKADLRALGIPLETEKLDRFDETLGYRIDPKDYDLSPIALDPTELTALALSVQLTGLADEAAPALDKLAVDANLVGEQRVQQRVPLELGMDAPNRAVLTDALLAKQRVRFAYRSVAQTATAATATTRLVEPHALLHWRGRWYLRGVDVDKAAERTFRLDRIDGEVRPTGDPGVVDVPDVPPDPAEVVPGATGEPIDAVVDADEATAWQVARRSSGAGVPAPDRDGAGVPAPDGGGAGSWRRFTIRTWDPDELIGWLLTLGPGVRLVGPDPVRNRLVEHLDQILAEPVPVAEHPSGAPS